MDRRRRYARRLRHAARAPVRGVCGLCFERLCDNLLDPVIADLAWRTASRLVVDAIKAMLCEPIAPRPDGLARDAHYTCDLAVVQPIGRAQNDLGPLRIGARDLAASDTSVEHSRSSALSLILLAFRFATTASDVDRVDRIMPAHRWQKVLKRDTRVSCFYFFFI